MKGKLLGVSAARPANDGGKSYKSVHLMLGYDNGTGIGSYPKSYSVDADFPILVQPGDNVVFYERYFGTTRTGQPMVGLEVLEKDTSI